MLYDASARIILCNQRYLDMYGLSTGIVKPGCHFRDLIQHRQDTGSFDGDVDEFCSAIMRNVAQGKLTHMNMESAGRSYLIVNKPLAQGGIRGRTEATGRGVYFGLREVCDSDAAMRPLGLTRGLAGGRPWMLMEHSTSAVNWQHVNPAKVPGGTILDSLAHVARGADTHTARSAPPAGVFWSTNGLSGGTPSMYRRFARTSTVWPSTAPHRLM